MTSPIKTLFVVPAALAASIVLSGCSSPQEFADGAAEALGAASVIAACGILEASPYGEDLIRQLPAVIDFAESAVAQDAKWQGFLDSLKDAERQATVAKDTAAATASLAEAIKVCAANK